MTEQENSLPTEVPLPIALRQLIELHNTRLREQQEKSLSEIQAAALELMMMLGLNPEHGWRLDAESMKYVKLSKETSDGTTQVK